MNSRKPSHDSLRLFRLFRTGSAPGDSVCFPMRWSTCPGSFLCKSIAENGNVPFSHPPFRAFENTVKDFIRRHFVHFRSSEPLREAFYPFFPHTAHRISTVSPASRIHAISCAATAFFSAKVRAANSISRVSSPRLCARSLSCCRVCRCRWIFPRALRR